jgi:hypothetical protein
MAAERWCIRTAADDLEEGLFGQVVLWTFELLPWLDARSNWPAWDIRSRLYGDAPDHRVIPGVFDLAYDASGGTGGFRDVSMLALRVGAVSVLGNDWQGIHDLWHRFFKVPQRIVAQADAVGLPAGRTLGVHYRGTDKNLAVLDTNPVSIADMLDLVADFVQRHQGVDTLFLATDDHAFVESAGSRFPTMRILNLGEVAFHKSEGGGAERADRALLDCVLLSRCQHVLKCSSALSGFAKVLNPHLDIHRVAACKLFSDVPYFPDAYIPRLSSPTVAVQVVLARQFEGDWLEDPRTAHRFRSRFISLPRYSAWQMCVNAVKHIVSRAMGRTRKA